MELRESSDRECDIRAKGRKSVKSIEEKLTTESAAHALTKDANSKLCEEVGKIEELNKGLRKWMEKRKAGKGFYKLSDDTIASVREDLTKDYQELAEQHSKELPQILNDFEES